jgi:Putative MetA-pathway of phenol degradation
MNKIRTALLGVPFLLFPVALMAQATVSNPHDAQPERPTVATHAGTVAPGWFEIESGVEFDRFADHSHGGFVPTVLKFGVAPRFQLSVQAPIVHPAGGDATGFGDLAIGMKWRIVEGAPVLGDFAILPAIKAPTGSTNSGTGTGTTDFNLLLISSHEFGAVDLDLNVGYAHRSGDGTNAPRNLEVWTVAFGGPAHGRLGWVAELYGYPHTAGPAGSAPIVSILAGPTFELRKYIVLDAGFIGPLTGSQPRAVYAGIVYNIGHF